MEQREEPAPKPNPSDPQTPFSAAEITASFIRAKIGHAVFIPASKQQQARPANIRLRGVTAGVSYDGVEDGRQFGDIDRGPSGRRHRGCKLGQHDSCPRGSRHLSGT